MLSRLMLKNILANSEGNEVEIKVGNENELPIGIRNISNGKT